MLTLAALVMAVPLALQADTTVVLGHAERDLTGDGKTEILRVVGVGPTIYDFGVSFTIEAAGQTIYWYDMGRMTRTVGFDAGQHVISEAQHRSRRAFPPAVGLLLTSVQLRHGDTVPIRVVNAKLAERKIERMLQRTGRYAGFDDAVSKRLDVVHVQVKKDRLL
jgi:hypothetical protein